MFSLSDKEHRAHKSGVLLANLRAEFSTADIHATDPMQQLQEQQEQQTGTAVSTSAAIPGDATQLLLQQGLLQALEAVLALAAAAGAAAGTHHAAGPKTHRMQYGEASNSQRPSAPPPCPEPC
jgi:hypothetical protein